MDKELFRTIINEGWEYLADIELVHRNVRFESVGSYVIVGIRQAGKSYLLYQRLQEFLRNGRKIEEMVYVNFDDERLRGMQARDFDLILQAYYSMLEKKPILFFDEIQNVDGWANFARRLVNTKYQVFITGSNAKMLSRDIETILGGRYLEINLFPYDFKEYLLAMGVQLSGKWMYGRLRDKVCLYFNDYFMWGGFPELVRYKEKRIWLNSLFSRIFFNDIIVRYKIKNEEAMRLSLRRLAESVKQPVSYNRICNLVKSTGLKCSVSTVIDYIRYFQEACIIFPLENYASKFVEKETVKKHYFVDNGILSLFLTDPNSSLLENICAIHLHKKYGDELYYYSKNVEVDFYVPDECLAIQASYRFTDTETIEREVKALVKLNAAYPLKRAMIITRDDEGQINKDGLSIDVVPVWKWLILEKGLNA